MYTIIIIILLYVFEVKAARSRDRKRSLGVQKRRERVEVTACKFLSLAFDLGYFGDLTLMIVVCFLFFIFCVSSSIAIFGAMLGGCELVHPVILRLKVSVPWTAGHQIALTGGSRRAFVPSLLSVLPAVRPSLLSDLPYCPSFLLSVLPAVRPSFCPSFLAVRPFFCPPFLLSEASVSPLFSYLF